MTEIVLNSILQQLRGVIGREPEPGERFVFEFDDVRQRDVHMVGVTQPLRVTWLVDGEIEYQATLQPWTGYDRARADRVIEEAVSG